MVEILLTGLLHSLIAELAEFWQVLLKDRLSVESCRRVESVADVTAGA